MNWLERLGKEAGAIVSIGSAVAVMFFAFNYFQTDAEAQQYQQQHGKQLIEFRVQTVETQISQYRYKLLSEKLSVEQRQWIEGEIKKLEEQIKCIREEKC